MHRSTWALLPLLAAFAAGCASTSGEATTEAKHEPAADCAMCENCPFTSITDAVCAVHPTHGNKAHGVIRFSQVEGGVRMVGEIEGLTPNAKHAFHIHEFGDCTSPDGKSAGGHYNPEGHPHAGPDAAARHAGDLGNLESDAHGVAHLDRVTMGATIAGHQNPILGRSIIIHASADDFATQPTGNAGDRIACGVIGVAKAPAK